MKNSSILLMILIISLKGFAQESVFSKSFVGIKAGYNLATVTNKQGEKTDFRHGIHIGLYAEEFLAPHLSLQGELFYSQQGYKIEASSYEFTQKLDYINLPILLKLYPNDYFFLGFGFQFGVAVSKKEELRTQLVNSFQDYGNPRSLDWGLNFDFGFRTESGINFTARYHSGQSDLFGGNSSFKNRIWLFSVGFDF